MNWFKNLSAREKLIIGFALLALSGLFIHAVIWQPMLDQKTVLLEQLELEKNDLKWIKQNIVKIQPNHKKEKNITGSLVSWLDLRIKKFTLQNQLKRIRPDGENQVKFWLEKAKAKDLIKFMGDLSLYHISIEEIKITALDQPGYVDASLVVRLNQ